MPLKKKSAAATKVRAAVLAHYLEVAERLGLNPQGLLSKVGLSRAILKTPDQQIPLSAAVDLLELSAQATQCESFGLLMAEARQFSDLGPVSLLLTHQRTVRDAVNTTMQYRHLLNEGLAMHVEDTGKLTLVREEVISAISPTPSIRWGALPSCWATPTTAPSRAGLLRSSNRRHRKSGHKTRVCNCCDVHARGASGFTLSGLPSVMKRKISVMN
jgi:hypothetical protein